MGMFDTITDGYQVKAFPVPCYYGARDGIGMIGGLLRAFGKGDKVPIHTWWYNYPKNFMIIDMDTFEGADCYHVIFDGKVFATFDEPEDIPHEVFTNIEMCMDYHGNPIRKMDDLVELLQFKSETIALNREIDDLWKTFLPKSKRLLELRRKENPNDPAVQEEIEKLIQDRDLEGEMIDAKRKAFWDKWGTPSHDERQQAYETFGMYLDCISDEIVRDERYADPERCKEMLGSFEAFCKKNDIDLDEYYERLQITDTEKAVIGEILNFVSTGTKNIEYQCDMGVDLHALAENIPETLACHGDCQKGYACIHKMLALKRKETEDDFETGIFAHHENA